MPFTTALTYLFYGAIGLALLVFAVFILAKTIGYAYCAGKLQALRDNERRRLLMFDNIVKRRNNNDTPLDDHPNTTTLM